MSDKKYDLFAYDNNRSRSLNSSYDAMNKQRYDEFNEDMYNIMNPNKYNTDVFDMNELTNENNKAMFYFDNSYENHLEKRPKNSEHSLSSEQVSNDNLIDKYALEENIERSQQDSFPNSPESLNSRREVYRSNQNRLFPHIPSDFNQAYSSLEAQRKLTNNFDDIFDCIVSEISNEK